MVTPAGALFTPAIKFYMANFDFSFQQIVESTRDIVIVTKAYPLDDSGPEIVYVNKAFTDLTEYTFDEVVGQTLRLLQSEEANREQLDVILKSLAEHKAARIVVSNRSKTGQNYWLDLCMLPLYNDQGDVTHYVAIERDVTEQVEREERIASQATTDSLTGLLNRRSFDEALAEEFSRFQRRRSKYSVLMLTIDNFKDLFKDQHGSSGQGCGDSVLVSLARRFKDNIRLHDTLARIGAEEFSIISPHSSQKEALKMAEKLRQRVEELSLQSEGQSLQVTVSFGVSEVDFEDYDHTSVLERAEEALHEAKERGGNAICGR